MSPSHIDIAYSTLHAVCMYTLYATCCVYVHYTHVCKPSVDELTHTAHLMQTSYACTRAHTYVIMHLMLQYFTQVLNDTTRLVKRTQLKRFTSSVLGKRQRVEGTGEEVGDAPKKMPDGAYDDLSGDPSGERDAHLRDCDEEIFDDEDFYHRVSCVKG